MTQRRRKGLTKTKANKLGLDQKNFKKAPSAKSLLEMTPNYVLAKAVNDTMLSVDGLKMKIPRSSVLAMPLEVYVSCERDKNNRHVQLKPYKRKFAHNFRRYKGQSLNNKSLFVMRTGGIGDLIFSQPLLKHLKREYPASRIIYATAPRHMPIIESWPKGIVDAVVPIPFSLDILKQTHYHLAFEGSIERNDEGTRKNAYDLFAEMACVENDIDFRDPELALDIQPDEKIIESLKPELPENFLVIQMRATSPIRMMDVEKWYEVIDDLHSATDLNFVFIDVEKHSGYYDKIIEDFVLAGLDKNRFFNLCSISKDINHAVNIISLSEGVIGIDSAMVHICEGLKKPGICIYGPFKADLRVRYYNHIKSVEPDPKKVECEKWPCMWHGNEIFNCPYKRDNQLDPQCMTAVDTQEISKKALELFKSKEPIDGPTEAAGTDT